MSTLERAIAIASQAHTGAVDKAGAPYILHPLRVMFGVVGDDAARIAAVLHDLIEDTDWTLDGLRAEGFSEDVVAAIDGVTKREGEDYLDFCRRAARHPIARAVKLADLRDNMDLARLKTPGDKDRERMKRYEACRAIIEYPG